jgi:GH18 family chitinase
MISKFITRLNVLIVMLFMGRAVLASEFDVIGYSMNPTSPIVLDHASKHITDLVYFSVEPAPDGSIDASGVSAEGFDAVRELIADRGIRVHLAVGGWGRSDHFAAACETQESRAKLIQALVNLCAKHGLSGVDYDWEFPKSAEEYDLFSALIVESKKAFQSNGLALSAAFSPWQKFGPEVYAALDRVHLMTYDFNDKHSTLEKSKDAVDDFLAQGVPAEKLFMGVPFYGRKIDDAEHSITYGNLMDQHEFPPDVDEIDGFYFNGQTTISSKVRFAMDRKLGGIMIWELGQDVSDHRSLVRTIEQTIEDEQ